MHHVGIAVGLGVVMLLGAIMSALAWYEEAHRLPCSLCNGTRKSVDGIRCPFCAHN